MDTSLCLLRWQLLGASLRLLHWLFLGVSLRLLHWTLLGASLYFLTFQQFPHTSAHLSPQFDLFELLLLVWMDFIEKPIHLCEQHNPWHRFRVRHWHTCEKQK